MSETAPNQSRSESGARGLLVPSLLALAVFALLVSLGVWQLHRLAWKEDLIAKIDARAHGPAVAIPPQSAWASLRPDDYEYRHVSVSGRFEHDKEALVFRASGPGDGLSKPGYLVMTPLQLDDGSHVLIGRGFVPEESRDPAMRAAGQIEGEVTVTGLMRAPEPRNTFTPADTPAKNQWFTRDPLAIAAHFGLERSAPFSIDADATLLPGGLPRGGVTVVTIPNDHLSYALTWFGLAATLVVIFGLVVIRRTRRP
ncbi:MAG: SURF1-like protein [Hyphomicrobiales bacterium]|nr:SURF1-like protein [Hyphomicrobiales bacterium]